MSTIIYKDSKGEIHEVESGVPVKLGADWEEVGLKMTYEEQKLDDALTKLANSVGVSVDIMITRAAAALGIEKCARCQMRGHILRKMGELGFVETVRRLRKTFTKDA